MTVLKPMTEQQRAVAATILMRLTRQQALAYMEAEGYPMSSTSYGRIRSYLKRTTDQQLHRIAQLGFKEQHLARIQMVEHIEQEMWKQYKEEPSPYRKTLILKEIKEIQLYISTYYETTRTVLESSRGNGQASSSVQPALTTREAEPRVE